MTPEITSWTLSVPGLLADIGPFSIIILIIVAASVFFDWLKKKAGEGTSTDSFEPGPFRAPPKAEKTQDDGSGLSEWERQIRELLQAEQTPPPVPPPVARQAPPPLPVRQTQPVVIHEPALEPSSWHVPEQPSHHDRLAEMTRFKDEAEQRLARARHLSETAAAFVRHGHTDARAAASKGSAAWKKPGPPTRTAREDLRAFALSLRSPATARGAIVAAAVIGPPKALET